MGNINTYEVKSKNTLELLYKINETGYNYLKKNNGDSEYLFNLGEVLGDEEYNRREVLIKAKIAKETLDSIINSSSKFFKKIKTKIEGYKKIELAFQILTALGGSALLITLTAKFEDNPKIHFYLQMIGALIATIGSLLSVFLNKGLGSWSFNRRNRVQDYDNLVLFNIKASKLVREIDPKIQVFEEIDNLEDLVSIITETESLSEKVGLIVADYS